MTGPTADTLVQEWTWKTPAMRDMTMAVCRLAMARGQGTFSALDLQMHGAGEHGGTGIAGSVFRQLADAGIIAPVGVFVDGAFIQKRQRNAGGNPIGVWRLANHSLAAALVARHAPAAPAHQQVEMSELLTAAGGGS